jgi:hypothetical protein
LYAGAEIAMKQEEVVASGVRLAHPINTADREGALETLQTVGDAARFLLANFTRERAADSDWQLAASALERAAESDTGFNILHATNAVIALLEIDKLIRR